MPLSNTWTPSLTCTLSDITISGLSVDLNGTYTKVDDYNTAPSWVIDYGLLSNTEPGYVFIRTYNSNNYIIEVTQRTSSTWVWGVFNTTTELWEASGANTYTNSTLLPCPSGESWVLLSPPTADLFTMAAEGGGFETPGLGNGGLYGYNYSNSPEVLASKNYGLNIGSRRSVNVITPTFDRDFVTYGTLNHGTGPNITFTRASSATVFTSTGILSTVPNDVPRFEWGSFRTNLIPYSEDFSNWTVYQGIILTNRETSPNGTTTVDILSGTVIGGDGYVHRALTLTPGTTGTFSCWMGSVNENFSTRIRVVNSDWSFLGNKVVNLTPTLQRETVNFTVSSDGFVRFILGGSQTLSADRQVYLWGAQVEYGLSATNYIPTTTSAVTTGVPLGLLIEESRTNFVGDQNLFNWATIDGTSPLSAGTGIASLSSFIIDDTSSINYHQRNYNFPTALLSSTTYCFSCYVKKNPKFNNLDSLLRMRYSDTAGNLINQGFAGIWFNQATGQTGMAYTTTTSAVSVQDFGTFFRTSFTFNTQTTGQPIRVDIIPSAANPFGAALSGTSIEVAGIQVEQGSFPTSYIPTAGLSATRQADIARVTPISTFVSPNGAHTFFAEYNLFGTGGNYPNIFGLGTTSSGTYQGNQVIVFNTPSTTTPTIFTYYNTNYINEFYQFSTGSAAIPLNTIGKYAAGFGYNSGRVAINGVLQGTANDNALILHDTSTLNGLGLGCRSDSAFVICGYFRKFTYWPTRLSNNRLRTLTLSA